MRKYKLEDANITSYGRTILGFILDSIICAVLSVILTFSFSSLISSSMKKDEIYSLIKQFAVDSSLYYANSSSSLSSYINIAPYEVKDTDPSSTCYGYEVLENKVWTYYTEFLQTNTNATTTLETQAQAQEWVITNLYKLTKSNPSSTYYMLATKDGEYDFTSKPVLNAVYKEKVNKLDETGLKDLLSYYTTPKTGLYVTALSDFLNQSYYVNETAKISYINFISYAPFTAFSILGFFFIVPLFTPYGQTIGKLVVHTAVISKDKNKATKWQIVFHYLIITLALLAAVVSQYVFLTIIAVLFLAGDFLAKVLTSTNQSFHDKLASTIVVNIDDLSVDNIIDIQAE